MWTISELECFSGWEYRKRALKLKWEKFSGKGKSGAFFFFLHVGWEKRVALNPSEIDYSAHAWLFKSNSKCMLTYFWGHYGDFPYSQ